MRPLIALALAFLLALNVGLPLGTALMERGKQVAGQAQEAAGVKQHGKHKRSARHD